MSNTNLSEQNWDKIFAFLKESKGIYVKTEKASRCFFVEALLWELRSGAQWRLLPKRQR